MRSGPGRLRRHDKDHLTQVRRRLRHALRTSTNSAANTSTRPLPGTSRLQESPGGAGPGPPRVGIRQGLRTVRPQSGSSDLPVPLPGGAERGAVLLARPAGLSAPGRDGGDSGCATRPSTPAKSWLRLAGWPTSWRRGGTVAVDLPGAGRTHGPPRRPRARPWPWRAGPPQPQAAHGYWQHQGAANSASRCPQFTGDRARPQGDRAQETEAAQQPAGDLRGFAPGGLVGCSWRSSSHCLA